MMTNIFKYPFALLLLTASIFTSCRKDLGNYTYTEINEGTINNMETAYSASRGAMLTINPSLVFTKDDKADTSKYTYSWTIIDQNQLPVTKKIIANSKNLNWQVNIDASSRLYTLIYEVTEKSSGIFYRRASSLTITSEIADGWLVLNDIDGAARLDFFSYLPASNDFRPYPDITSTQSTIKLTGKPKMVYFMQRRDPLSMIIARSIFVGTDKETFIINTHNNTFSNFVPFTKAITSYSPAPYYAERVAGHQFPTSLWAYLLDSNGKLYFESPTQGNTFGVGVNKTITGEKFKISPYFAEDYKMPFSYVLMYDTQNKRFMENKDNSTSSSVPSTTSKLFSPGNMNMDLIYMASTAALSGRTYAVLKNNVGKIFLAIISCNAFSFDPLSFEEITTAPEIAMASSFAIDPVEGYLMYAVGSKVYRYNSFDKTNTVVVDAGNKMVSFMKYQRIMSQSGNQRYLEYSKKLIVCTYDPASPNTSGTMDLYTVPNLNGTLSLYKSFSGLGKVVDVSYRE